VHEAYLRLVDVERVKHWDSRGHFFAAAAEAMRRILVENARRKARLKYGGDHRRVDLDKASPEVEGPACDLLAVHEALDKLAAEDPSKAELVKLRYFVGMSLQEAADALAISRATAARYWTYAKTWLYCEIQDGESA
jgi:RNA polymerase sigma factor (TIGR02999 family)